MYDVFCLLFSFFLCQQPFFISRWTAAGPMFHLFDCTFLFFPVSCSFIFVFLSPFSMITAVITKYKESFSFQCLRHSFFSMSRSICLRFLAILFSCFYFRRLCFLFFPPFLETCKKTVMDTGETPCPHQVNKKKRKLTTV